MKAVTVFVASDGSRWDSEAEAVARDVLDAAVRDVEQRLPTPPSDSGERIAVDPEVFRAAKTAVVELCRAEYPNEAVFQHDPMDIHPFSFAGRLLDDVGGPLRRIWWRFMCYRDGWMYQQPYFALNPDKFQESSR
jgi:hypothetical protein